MRRLVGFSFVHEEPLRGGFVRLDDVTVLTGANDTGKTRLLGLIESVLARFEADDGADVFGIAAADEVAELIDSDTHDGFWIDQFAQALGRYADVLDDAAGGDEVWVGVRMDGGFAPPSAWRFGRAPAELGGEACEEVLDALPEGAGSGDPREPVKLEYLGRPQRALLPEAVVVPGVAGEIERRAESLVFRLTRAVQNVALVCCAPETNRGVRDELVGWLEPLIAYSPHEPALSWRHLVSEGRHVSEVEPALIEACAALERIVAGLLPAFISDEYRLEITPEQPTAVAQGAYVRLRLMRRDTQDTEDDEAYLVDSDADEPATDPAYNAFAPGDPDDGAVRFALREAPAGFVVWLELAVNEAIARAEIISFRIEVAVRRLETIRREYRDDHPPQFTTWEDVDEQVDEPAVIDPPDYEDDGIDPVRHETGQLIGYLRDPSALAPATGSPLATERLEGDDDFGAPPVNEYFAAPCRKLYLVDEPEQRLHPTLQRRAARWLSSAMRQWDCQAVIATHAIAFIDIPGNREVYELSRHGQQCEIERIDPSQITPTTPLARAVGLDRGELLTRYRMFVVASPSLAALLDELTADRLEQAGIKLVAADLARPGELGAVTILCALTTAPIAAVFLSPTTADLKRLQTAGADERAALAAKPGELGGIARVLSAAAQHARYIDLVTLERPDITSLLSDAKPPVGRGDVPGDEPWIQARIPPTPGPISELLWDLERRALTEEN